MSSAKQLAKFSAPADRGAPPVAPSRRLTQKQKAAIIVRFLLNEGADLELKDLPDDLQAELTYLMGGMGLIDRDTLGTVLMEFAQALESIGLSFPGGVPGALNVLEGRISPMTAARLRKEAGVRQTGDPWQRIRALSIPELADLIAVESTEVAAVMISKLDVAKAAELLGALSGEQARRITYAVSMTGNITPEAVDRIGLTLASQLDDVPPRAFADEPVDRIGAILNSSTSATRDDLLSGLDETDATFAGEVRKTIFTYAHIPGRIDPRDAPRVVKEAGEEVMIAALAFATSGDIGQASDFLLANISPRLAEQMREGVEELGKVNGRDGEAALSRVTAVIRDLVEAGELKLIRKDEEEE